jgi:hypothetical protein
MKKGFQVTEIPHFHLFLDILAVLLSLMNDNLFTDFSKKLHYKTWQIT